MKKGNIVPDEELNILRKTAAKKEPMNLDIQKLTAAVSYNSEVNNLNEDIFSLFPNIKLAIEIMTSSILAPNTMTYEDYNLTIKSKILPLDILGSIINNVKEHIDTHYKFKDRLHEVIEETVFTKGSYCELILPPDLIVDLYKKFNKKKHHIDAGIEDAMESLNYIRPTNFLNLPKTTKNNDLISLSENYSFFIKDKLIETMINNNLNYGIDVGLEDSIVVDSILALDDSLEINNDFNIAFVKKIPNDSVLPISDKDDPKKHYGYFVFLNNTGTPIQPVDGDMPDNKNVVNFGLAGENKKISEGEKLIKKAKENLTNIAKQAPEIDNKSAIVDKLISNKIMNTLKNSMLKDLVSYDIELKQEMTNAIYKKISNNEKINVIFVPSKYLAYYATNYRNNGTGKSVLEEIQLLASIKAMLFLTRMTAYIRGAITITDVKVELDETEENPDRVLAKLLNYVKKSRQMQLPMGMLKVNDLVDWLHNVGFKVTAKHPKLPNFDIDIDENALPVNIPDDSLEELIDKYQILTIGVTPEMVNNGYSADFATTIDANNVLMIKRILAKQKLINPLLTENIRKYIQNDPLLYNKIKSIINKNIPAIKKKLNKLTINDDLKKKVSKLNNKVFSAWVFKEILRNLNASLPKPELSDDNPNSEIFDKLNSNLDSVLDVILSTDMFDSDLLGDLADKIDNQKSILKGIIMYKWMTENRFLPEVSDMFTVDEDGNPILNLADEYKTLVEALKANILPLLKEMSKFKKKSDEQMDKIENPDEGGDDNDGDSDKGDGDNTANTSDDGDDTGDTDDDISNDDNTSSDDTSDSDSDDSGNSDKDTSSDNENKDETGDVDDNGDDLTKDLF